MSERAKGAQVDLAGSPGRRSQADALEPSGDVNPEKLRQNQQRLHVGSDHKTDAMKKGKRGTFP
jgi:hypothetical protein